MKRKARLPELLAPAGDFDCLVAAVKGGADAVYVGGKSFGARAYAKNFEQDELARAVLYCHLHGVRLYVTVNTLLTDEELPSAIEFAIALYRIGVDALIVADLGLVRELRRVLPEMELHASTQMSVHNREGADLAYSLGCTRVVLAREVCGESIAKITDQCLAEVEVFVHGALCVCHSGQCLFSSLVGGRSGNRGECAQPCRLPYDGGYPLSLTDLSLASHIPSLIRTGVASLKIEGRMKSPDYVYTVTSIYRGLLDEERAPTREERQRLLRAFSRGGFTDGYYIGDKEGRNMLGVRSQDDKRATVEDRKGLEKSVITPTCVKITASASIRRSEPSRLSFTIVENGSIVRNRTVSVTGEVPADARSHPLDKEEVKDRLSRLGGTFFELSHEDIDLTLDEGLNLSPSAINALRRNAVSALEAAQWRSKEYALQDVLQRDGRTIKQGALRTAMLYEPSRAASVSALFEKFDYVFIPLWRLDEAPTCEKIGIAIPPVVMEEEYEEIRALATKAAERGIRYALICNIGQLSLCRKLGLIPFADFRLNVTNSSTGRLLTELGINNYLLSPELTAAKARLIGGVGIVYGRIPLMITERCFMRDNYGCKSCSVCALTDRRGAQFPMIREYRHRTLILNSAVTYMGDKRNELHGIGEHFIFSTESTDEIIAVINAYDAAEKMPLPYSLRRMGRRSVRAD